MKCPIQCGQCCDYWQDVESIVAHAVKRGWSHTWCPHEGKRGCKLSRAKRPAECTEYLCGVASAVIADKIEHNEGVRLKEHGHIEVPYSTRRSQVL